jgi:enoyl-CoA hydratase/carnithine racemase
MIRWHLDHGIAHLTLDRGGARNAIPIAGWEALATAAGEIAASDARVVVLSSGMPGIFSAGADLAEMRRLVEDAALRPRFRGAMYAGIESVAALPMPVVAAIDGGCFGAAVALTLACDIVVAGDEGVFATTPAKLGLSYPASDVARLSARVGEGTAALMLFTGNRVDANAALARSLAHVRASDAAREVLALAEAIAANEPSAVRTLKQLLRDPNQPHHAATFDEAFGTPAFAERLTAFLNGKR